MNIDKRTLLKSLLQLGTFYTCPCVMLMHDLKLYKNLLVHCQIYPDIEIVQTVAQHNSDESLSPAIWLTSFTATQYIWKYWVDLFEYWLIFCPSLMSETHCIVKHLDPSLSLLLSLLCLSEKATLDSNWLNKLKQQLHHWMTWYLSWMLYHSNM